MVISKQVPQVPIVQVRTEILAITDSSTRREHYNIAVALKKYY